MRTRLILFVVALLACWGATAAAQQATGQQPAEQTASPTPWQITLANWFDAGVRVTSTAGDTARFERYRDPRTGPFLDRFRFEKETGPGTFAVALDNVGYRDQRLFGQYRIPGKMRFSVEWNQVPQFWSINTHSPFSNPGTAVQTLPAGAALAVQTGTPAATVYNGLPFGTFDQRARRDTLTLNLIYNLTDTVDLNFYVRTAARNGQEPQSISSGFTGAADISAPVDTRTTDLNAGAQWSTDKGMLSLVYDGSWFKNHQESIVVDNPFRATDIFGAVTASARARFTLAPTNQSNTVTAAGAYNLPRARVNAAFSIGNWTQDTPLVPMTINSAIPAVTLPRSTADADIRRINGNVSVSSRLDFVNLSARYRYYNFDDRTPPWDPVTLVEYDAQVEPFSDELLPAHFSHRNNFFEAEATVSKFRPASFSVGYRFNRMDYDDREVTRTNEHTGFASIDSNNLGIFSLHLTYEHARRRAPDFNTTAFADLEEGGEQPGLRRYDVSDRDRDSGTFMVQVMPASMFAISGSVTAAQEKYPNLQLAAQDAFGLQFRKSQGYSVFFDVTPSNDVIVSAGYGYQKYDTNQRARQVSVDPATPLGQAQFLDPTRDWTVAEDEKVHFAAASLELTNIFPKTALRLTYDFNRSESPYVYSLIAGGTLANPSQLPALSNKWHTATADVRYFIRKNLAAGITYWYDRYIVNDTWSMGANIEDRKFLPGLLLLGYGFRPYTAHSGWLRVFYVF